MEGYRNRLDGCFRRSGLTGENPDAPNTEAKLSDKSFAAHWIEGGHAFSFMGENMKEKDFESLLSGYFIDVTEHVFGTDDASSIHHDMPF